MTLALARYIRKWSFILTALGVMLLFAAPEASAHTKLKESTPASDEVLQTPPSEIKLIFSGKLEDALHTMELASEGGEAIPFDPPALDETRKILTAALPELPNGKYTVSYRVISADGHPIEGSFAFEVQAPAPEPAEPAPPAETTNPGGQTEPTQPAVPAVPEAGQPPADEHTGHEEHEDDSEHVGHEEQAAAPNTFYNVSIYAASILFYVSMLAVAGWALWSLFYSWREADRKWRMAFGLGLLGFHLAAFLLLAALHIPIDLQAENSAGAFLDFLRNTDTGRSYLFGLLLTVAGFPLLFRYRIVDGIWAALLISAKTLRGHASIAEPVALARLADGVHIAAASLWVGGLIALIIAFRRNKELFRALTPRFSSVALTAFVVLIATGIATSLWIADYVSVILTTAWGWLLLAKIALVAIVIPVAFMLRRAFSAEREGRFKGWLRADVLLMAAIITVTGILAHTSPLPDREPLHWHVMGETIHMTADLSPNLRWRNELTVYVWVPEGEEAPASVTAGIWYAEGTDSSVDLKPMEDTEGAAMFPGFLRFKYEGKVSLKDPERDTLLVTVERASGEQVAYEKKLSES